MHHVVVLVVEAKLEVELGGLNDPQLLLLAVVLGPAASVDHVDGQEVAVLRRGLEGMCARGEVTTDVPVHGLGDDDRPGSSGSRRHPEE